MRNREGFRPHFYWNFFLEQKAYSGDLLPRKILDEGKNPGEYFDGLTHMCDFLKVMRELKKDDPNIRAIGVFGSRVERRHRPLISDLDVLVLTDSLSKNSEIDNYENIDIPHNKNWSAGICNGIHIEQCEIAIWRDLMKNPDKYKIGSKIAESVRWVWIKPGFEVNNTLQET